MKLFEIYFLRFDFSDLLDIVIMAYILYKLYGLMRGTIAFQIFLGIIALYLVDVIVTAADMTMLRFLFGNVSEVFVLAIIILFQPELRRLLVMVGRTPGFRRFMRQDNEIEIVDEVMAAVDQMSKRRIGALLVFARNAPLQAIIETGTELRANVERDLILSIFHGTSPLHDGAVIIQSQRIEAARCILPVSQSMRLSPHLGLRHRAAVGLTEQNDAFVIVVSEETGGLSVSVDGRLVSNLSREELRRQLVAALSAEPVDESVELIDDVETVI